MTIRATVNLREQEGRRPRVHIKDGDKSLRPVSFDTVDEAQEFANYINQDTATDAIRHLHSMSIDQIMEQHREHIRANTTKGGRSDTRTTGWRGGTGPSLRLTPGG